MKTLKIFALSAAVLATAAVAHADDERAHHGQRGKGGYAAHLERIDTDKDGKISRAEHLAAAEEHFNRMDKDGDGFITAEERKAAHAEMKEKFKDRKEQRKERRGKDKDKD